MQSFVPVVPQTAGRDDEQSPRDALFGVRTEHPSRTEVVRQKSADGNRRGHNRADGRTRLPRPAVLATADRSVFAVAAVDAVGTCSTDRASGGRAQLPCANPQFIGRGLDTLDGEPTRSKRDPRTQGGGPQPTRHLRSGQIASVFSLRPVSVPIDTQAVRTGRNPATNATIQIKASKKVRFQPAKELKEAI